MSTELPSTANEIGYRQLRSIAQRLMNRESHQCTLTATGLVHELYVKIAKSAGGAVPGTNSSVPFASRLMQQILIDRARRRQTRKRSEDTYQLGTTNPVARSECQNTVTERALQLEDALQLLAKDMPETAELVRLKVYLDLSIDSAASQLGIPRATAYRKWTFAKAWLTRHLQWPLDF